MLTNSLSSFLFYFNHFELIDYGAYIWFIFLVFLFFALFASLISRYTLLGFFALLLFISVFIIGPFGIKWYLNGTIRKNETTLELIKQLHFSDTLILKGQVFNKSKRNFSTCKLNFGFFKNTKNKYKQFVREFFPPTKHSLIIQDPIDINSSAEYKVVLENFRLADDINITVKTECY